MAAVCDAPRAPWAPSASDPTEATISARSLAKARGTVEDLARSYFPVFGLPVDDVLCFADSVYFVAASLYEIDELNEVGAPAAAARAALEAFLRGRGLLCDKVRAALARGDAYWRLERDLVAAWRRTTDGGGDDEDALLEAATRASSMKSFDYETLSLVVLGLSGKASEPRLLAFLNACFQLVEVEDDLRDYVKDVKADTFNVYRAFVRRHGADAPSRLRTWIAGLEAAYVAARDAAGLDAAVLRFHVERNEQQGGAGPAMAPRTGAWEIPKPLAPLGPRRRR